jgi:hypothetical protein
MERWSMGASCFPKAPVVDDTPISYAEFRAKIGG